MKRLLPAAIILSLFTWTTFVGAQDAPKTAEEYVKIAKSLKYRQGEIDLPGGIAKLNVPSQFNFLGAADAEKVLTKLWHNPPSTGIIGMLLPSDKGPLSDEGWAVTIEYTDDGYISDKDAAKIDYNDILKTMQKATKSNNAKRQKEGYPPIDLVGWAEPPHYDAEAHKLYWARELMIDNDAAHTLNYDIRILGRRGVLVLTAVASMPQLDEIRKGAPQILSMVNFNDGSRYTDFDPKVDKVATYGIAALVAGGIATKLGLFKLIWVFILAAKKFIIIAIAAIAASIKKLFGKRDSRAS
jgi:uncharacterized membrane-anchored protein